MVWRVISSLQLKCMMVLLALRCGGRMVAKSGARSSCCHCVSNTVSSSTCLLITEVNDKLLTLIIIIQRKKSVFAVKKIRNIFKGAKTIKI